LIIALLISQAFALGSSVRGGGNTVGSELFDDYENSGSTVMTPEQIESYVAPYFADLEKKIPGFVVSLRRTMKNKRWYLEPKPLRQDGDCLNRSQLMVQLVVRACQSNLTVRIDQNFFVATPAIQGPLVLHELLVSLQLEGPNGGRGGVTDEGVREISRLARNPNTSGDELSDSLAHVGFESYLSSSRIADIRKWVNLSTCEIANDKYDKFIKGINDYSRMHEANNLYYGLLRACGASKSKKRL
jgi:hypothetical protein